MKRHIEALLCVSYILSLWIGSVKSIEGIAPAEIRIISDKKAKDPDDIYREYTRIGPVLSAYSRASYQVESTAGKRKDNWSESWAKPEGGVSNACKRANSIAYSVGRDIKDTPCIYDSWENIPNAADLLARERCRKADATNGAKPQRTKSNRKVETTKKKGSYAKVQVDRARSNNGDAVIKTIAFVPNEHTTFKAQRRVYQDQGNAAREKVQSEPDWQVYHKKENGKDTWVATHKKLSIVPENGDKTTEKETETIFIIKEEDEDQIPDESKDYYRTMTKEEAWNITKEEINDDLWDTTKEKTSGWWETTKEIASNAGDKIKNIGENALEKAGKVWDVVKNKTNETWDKTKDTSSNAWDKTKEKASDAWDKTKEKASEFKDKTQEKTAEAWDKTKEKTAEAWDKTKEKTAEAWDKTKEKTVEAWDKTKEKTAGAWDKTKEKTAEAWDKTKEKTAGAWDKTKEKTAGAWDKTKEKTVHAWDLTKEKAASVWNKTKVKAAETWDKTKKVLSPGKAKEKAEDEWYNDKIRSRVYYDKKKRMAEEAWNETTDKSQDIWDKIKDKSEEAWEKTKEKAKDVWDKAEDKSKDVAEETVERTKEKIKEYLFEKDENVIEANGNNHQQNRLENLNTKGEYTVTITKIESSIWDLSDEKSAETWGQIQQKTAESWDMIKRKAYGEKKPQPGQEEPPKEEENGERKREKEEDHADEDGSTDGASLEVHEGDLDDDEQKQQQHAESRE